MQLVVSRLAALAIAVMVGCFAVGCARVKVTDTSGLDACFVQTATLEYLAYEFKSVYGNRPEDAAYTAVRVQYSTAAGAVGGWLNSLDRQIDTKHELNASAADYERLCKPKLDETIELIKGSMPSRIVADGGITLAAVIGAVPVLIDRFVTLHDKWVDEAKKQAKAAFAGAAMIPFADLDEKSLRSKYPVEKPSK